MSFKEGSDDFVACNALTLEGDVDVSVDEESGNECNKNVLVEIDSEDDEGKYPKKLQHSIWIRKTTRGIYSKQL